MSLRTDRVRLVVMFKKKDTITREEFDRYWVEEHAKLFSSLAIVKSNVLKYEQVSLDLIIEPATCTSIVSLLRHRN